MHELSIALQIVEAATKSLSGERASAIAVHVRLGELAGVVKSALESAWQSARMGSPLATADLVLEEVAATAWCAACRAERPVVSPYRFCCVECGGPVGTAICGRELEIIALEVTDDDDDTTG